MTKKELLSLPLASYNEEIPQLDYLYLIPTMKKHDSGYRIIVVVGENIKLNYMKITVRHLAKARLRKSKLGSN